MSDGRGRAEHWLELHSGWGQLLATIIAWVAMAAGLARGLSDQAEANRKTAEQLTMQLVTISDKVTNLAVSTERLAEHVAVFEHDSDRRIERLERAQDGGKR